MVRIIGTGSSAGGVYPTPTPRIPRDFEGQPPYEPGTYWNGSNLDWNASTIGQVAGPTPQPAIMSPAQQYAANPTSNQFIGIDPAIFGYPPDNTGMPQPRPRPTAPSGLQQGPINREEYSLREQYPWMPEMLSQQLAQGPGQWNQVDPYTHVWTPDSLGQFSPQQRMEWQRPRYPMMERPAMAPQPGSAPFPMRNQAMMYRTKQRRW